MKTERDGIATSGSPPRLNPQAGLVRPRVLGRFDGVERGPLLIAIGAMHGNEPAGVLAIERAFELLAHERAFRPAFAYRGRFVGLTGNRAALAMGRRFLRHDLNRWLDPERIEALRARGAELSAEDAEALALTDAVRAEVADYDPAHVVVIDLHTTTADGGFFSIVNDSPGGRAIALDLHAPVILGMLGGLRDTTLHYFTTAQFGRPVTSLVFESGSHADPGSLTRAVSALVNAMRSIGSVHPRDVEQRHNDALLAAAEGLPALVRFRYAHGITAADRFRMRPGYVNFDPVTEGEVLADDVRGEVRSPLTGRILMPLYQAQGEDGFFLVEEL